MKKSTLALTALTLALGAGLSACGGGSSTYTIGGVVNGLQYGPLILVMNGTTEVSIQPQLDAKGNPQSVNYAFPKELDYGETYDVTLKRIGTNAEGGPVYQFPPHQICEPSRTPGTVTSSTAGRLSVINAAFDCALVRNQVSGTVTGLSADNLRLTNGSTGGTVTLAKDATTFVFEQPVTYGQTYGVTVLENPAGQTCTVTNGAGTMGDDPVTNIAVSCRANG